MEAIAMPGHSMGSMCFINREQGYAIAGDSITTVLWLWIDRCPHISVYLDSLRSFIEKSKNISSIYCGHGLQPLPETITLDILRAGEELLDGKTEKDQPFIIPFDDDLSGIDPYIHVYGSAKIVYNRLKYIK